MSKTETAKSTPIILAGLDLMKDAETLGDAVWTIGNRLTEFEKRKGQIVTACEDALKAAYVKGYTDAKR